MNSAEQLDVILKRIESKLKNNDLVSRVVLPLIKSAVERNFDEKGRTGIGSGLFEGGNKTWAPLKPSTKKWYEKKGITPLVATLARTSNLKDSIDFRVNKNSIIMRAGGTDAPYAPYLQFGTKYMAARPYIQLTQSDIDQMVKILESELAKYL